MLRSLQRLARSGAAQATVMGELASPELRQPAAAAWHLQRRGAASSGGGGGAEQPGAAPAAANAQDKPAAGDAAVAGAGKKVAQQGQKQAAGQQRGKGPTSPKQGRPAARQQPAGAARRGGPRDAAQQGKASAAIKSLVGGHSVGELLQAEVGTYFQVPEGILPEATADFYKDPVLKGENVHEPNYGCKAVTREWEWSGHRALLARACMRELVETVQSKSRPHLFLDGWAGSGKSAALYSLVAWARANGWLALYVPSAFSLVQTGTFYQGEDGLWDTPEAARWILSSLKSNHSSQLTDLKTPSGQPLPELLEEGLAAAAKPAAAVAAAIAAKEALAAQSELPLLLAVDDYNVLYSHTGYYESMHNFHRRQLAPDELRLVRAFRILEQPAPANGVAVAAPTFGQVISERLRLPVPRRYRLAVPRYGLDEVRAAAGYFVGDVMRLGDPRHVLTASDLRRALFLTNGNAAELRRHLAALLGAQVDPMGLSRGYKAEQAVARRWETLMF